MRVDVRVDGRAGFGTQLEKWRNQRRVSQLELALAAGSRRGT